MNISDINKKENYNFEDLKEIIKILRSENGCPWDREQTHKSIRNNFIEEVYEAIEAIDTDDAELLKEELGDVLVQVVMHASISEDAGEFDINDVCDEICKKLIVRHPHVFGEAHESVDTAEQVLSAWENIKIREKGFVDAREYIESTARSLPALMRAEKIYSRAKKREIIEPFDVSEKLKELSKSLENIDNIDHIGKILFDIAAISSELGINPEQALYNYTKNFAEKIMENSEKISKNT